MNNRVRTIIVDDEKNSREVLSKLLEIKHPEVEVVGEAMNVEDAYGLCIERKPQLVFLDVQMPRADGFSLLKRFDEIPFEVVFVTGYDQYAISAIKFSALDYLLKPVEIEDLNFAIKKVMKKIDLKTSSQGQIINLLHSLDTDTFDRKFAIHNGGNVKMLSEKTIVFIEGDGRYSRLTMDTGEVFTTAKTLKEFEDYFGVKSSFIRISKSQIINSTYIKEYSKGEPFIIKMTTDKLFEVARRKKSKVLEKLR